MMRLTAEISHFAVFFPLKMHCLYSLFVFLKKINLVYFLPKVWEEKHLQ